MGVKLHKFSGVFPFLSNLTACLLTVIALATTSWFFHGGWYNGLFQKCHVESGRRKCTDLEGTLEERVASICLLVSVAFHFAASVVTCLGYIERRAKNFKIAGLLSLISGTATLSGTATYAVIMVTSKGYHLQYSFYVAVAALAWSIIATVASAVAISRVESIPSSSKSRVAEESVTDVTVLT